MIKKEFGYDVNYTVAKLDNEFGPTITHGPVEALVASSETSHKGNEINNIRSKKWTKSTYQSLLSIFSKPKMAAPFHQRASEPVR